MVYIARLTKADVTDISAAAGDDRPVVRWPKPQVKQFNAEDRTVVQMMVSPEVLASLDAAPGQIEVQLIPEATSD